MLHSTKSTHFSQIYYFFIVGKMCFEAEWNGFAGRIYPAGRSAENPDIDYVEEWWRTTPLSESNTNAGRLWFNSVDKDTIFWTGVQLLDGQQEAPVNTVLPQHPQKFFTRNRPYTIPRSTKHVYMSMVLSQDLSKVYWTVEICSVVLRPVGRDENRTGYHPALVQLFSRYLGIHSSWEA